MTSISTIKTKLYLDSKEMASKIMHKCVSSSQQLQLFFIPFQCYSLIVIGYRLLTFNDCEDAAESLRKVQNDIGNAQFVFYRFIYSTFSMF